MNDKNTIENIEALKSSIMDKINGTNREDMLIYLNRLIENILKSAN